MKLWPSARLWLAAATAAAVVTAPVLIPGYFLYILTLGTIWAIATIGLNLLTGYAGQISIGHAGFMGIGAYLSAILVIRLGWPFWLALPAAALAAGCVGWLLGVPALRLSGPYLAIATLGFGTAVSQILVKWEPVTGGYMGIKPPPPSFGPWTLTGDAALYYLAVAVLVGMAMLAANLLRGPVGRAFVALRDSEPAAQASGISLSRYKTLAFAISAFYAGIAGSLYGHVVGFISPFDFNLSISIFLLSVIVIGGLASIPGSIVGALVLTVGFQALGAVRDLRQVVYGLALVLMVIFLPGGLWRVPGSLPGLRRLIPARPSGETREEVGHAAP
ncbi:MAG: branched-chain amino acid ABC transporter permease [Armatimonadota bacterium]|nr:branched-chain amino acid ABC transporter permease [Armatimonadota bacterium]MDR7468524.1 branched-chain amino acid ABC transporter permease [Armatimonadota bacterium]MDR7474502.1 branched-chain amino acid ABC transporter permease [Armatimonadota bacterium]MDR7539825.1 branched-chain amino acid ABC transporter permease [Armatimonadota bacterium]